MSPGRGRGAHEAVARPDPGAVQGRNHHRRYRAVAVLHRFRQSPRRARRVLVHRHIVGRGVGRVRGTFGAKRRHELVIGDESRRFRRKRGEVGRSDQNRRPAIVEPQAQSVRPKQSEQRDRDAAGLTDKVDVIFSSFKETLLARSMPVLFTTGRYDQATPETLAYYDSLTPDSRLVILENSAHITMQDEPERYVEVVGEFLNEIESQR